MEKSYDTINFLDVEIYKDDGVLKTYLYTKETDTHQYIHAKSCHRSSTKRAIPYSQAVRIKRICSDEGILKERLLNLESWLLKRGYLSDVVHPEIERVHLTSRDVLFQKR